MGDQAYMSFPVTEYENRCNKARDLMAKKGLKGLLISEGMNYAYFSGGHRDFSYSRPQVMLLPQKGDPVAFSQLFPSWNTVREIWFKDVRIYKTMLGVPIDMVVEGMEEKGMTEGRIGVELDYEVRMGMSVKDWTNLKAALPKVEFVDASDLFWEIRMIKSPAEIERNRKACELTVRAYDDLYPSLHEGMSEVEIIEKFIAIQALLGGSTGFGIINSGPENYGSIGGGPTTRRIKKGDQVWIDGGCLYQGYASDFCCTGTVGPPSDKQKKALQMIWELTKRVIDKVRPGMKASDVDALNQAEWEKLGYNYNKDINWGGGRIGHGLGWGGVVTEPPHIAAYDNTVLKPGMIFTVEPGINFEYGCYQTECDCLLTENGLEILNKMHHEMRIIPV